ncbi:tryptophan synthase beta subunit-like PLP-dependent enzyme [Acephala macrosclerotiorum]|nr:tryptophan synthase beta subunit-like PLP-dependent enzyme [Acephala macrosclerotiorum]
MKTPKTTARRSVYYNPAAAAYKAPETKDNSAEIKAFYASLPDYAPTKLVHLPDLAAELGVKSVYVKAETSRLGLPSFKLLGASWAVRQAIIHHSELPSTASIDDLRTAIRLHGINLCAATDGNHGRSVAFMGRLLGVKETKVFVPKGLDKKIIDSIAKEGANVAVAEGDYDETVKIAHRFAEETEGFMLIEAVAYEGYEDVPRWAVEGYTTMLHEIDAQLLVHARISDQAQAPTMIIAPVGVGSLTQAIILHYKSPKNTGTPPAIMTVEPDTAGTLHKSLKACKSLSINTNQTIMAGLECGTLSSIAWPLLKPGVDISTTISDWECFLAITYLEKHGIGAGPCGAAALAGLRRLASDRAAKGVLNKDSVVICICTEGTRPYKKPFPVAGAELNTATTFITIQSLYMTSFVYPALKYVAQWLEHRDIDAKWVEHDSENPSVLAVLPSTRKVDGNERKKSLLLIAQISRDHAGPPNLMYTGVAATLLAFAKLKLSKSIQRGDIILIVASNEPGLRNAMATTVVDTLQTPDAAILINGAQEEIIALPAVSSTTFGERVKRSVDSTLKREVNVRTHTGPNPGIGMNFLAERGIPACVVGNFGDGDDDEYGFSDDEDSDDESDAESEDKRPHWEKDSRDQHVLWYKGKGREEKEDKIGKALVKFARDWCT